MFQTQHRLACGLQKRAYASKRKCVRRAGEVAMRGESRALIRLIIGGRGERGGADGVRKGVRADPTGGHLGGVATRLGSPTRADMRVTFGSWNFYPPGGI